MPQNAEGSIEQWRARALEECIAAGEAWAALTRRKVTIAEAIAGDVFGQVDAQYLSVCSRLELSSVDLLAAVTEIQRGSHA